MYERPSVGPGPISTGARRAIALNERTNKLNKFCVGVEAMRDPEHDGLCENVRICSEYIGKCLYAFCDAEGVSPILAVARRAIPRCERLSKLNNFQ